jgi:hypothetical protein
MNDAAFRLRWRACALLLAAPGAVLAVLPSRGAAAETAAPEAKSEVYQAWPFDAAEAKRLGIPKIERPLKGQCPECQGTGLAPDGFPRYHRGLGTDATMQ